MPMKWSLLTRLLRPLVASRHFSPPGDAKHHPPVVFARFSVFAELGYESATVRDIIRRTGLWIRLAHSEDVCRPEDLTPIAPQGSDLAESAGRT